MNVVGFCEPLLANFGDVNGATAKLLPEGEWWTFIYSTGLLIFCTCICLVGSSVFAKAGKVLFVTLLFSTLTVPLSTLFVQPFADEKFGGAMYTGFSWQTARENLLPHFTKGAAGSMIKTRENFQDMFAIFFPATCGIFAGASMSGDLKKPSQSIPQGTLKGLVLTYLSYSAVILAMGCCISRDLLYRDVQVLQNVNMNKYFILLGEFSTSLFSSIVGIIGSAKQLQALAKDDLLPFTKPFAQGTPGSDDPIKAVIFTYILAQITLLFDINTIATFITMAFLMTFVVTNLACFLLKIASAPNFRPSFKYFNTYTAGAGAAASIAAMFVADGISASMMIIILIVLFLVIHYVSLPKPWGDVSQALIYHQVRKYLLRLRQDHVKFWRPQILLLVDDPRSAWNLIHFCNHLKKGGLYILGHVVVTQDFQASFAELKIQQMAWLRLRDMSKVKAFVQIGSGPDVVWGARNVYMGSGLGGMKPNITVLGFFEKRNHGVGSPVSAPSNTDISLQMEPLPTDLCRRENFINVQQWVNIIEDLLTMRANIAIAKGFPKLQFPTTSSSHIKHDTEHKYIDLYPIQMSAQIIDENGETSALTTNFDTYTLILQMGAILRTVPAWKANHTLRVVVFVEFEEDMEEERIRIKILLERLRINAEILVLCLSEGTIPAYETIVHGHEDKMGRVEKLLGKHEWWLELQDARKEWARNFGSGDKPTDGTIPQVRMEGLMQAATGGDGTLGGVGSVNIGSQDAATRSHGSKTDGSSPPKGAFLKNRKRRHTISSLQQMGVSGLSMHTSKLRKSDLHHNAMDFYRDSESDTDESSTHAGNNAIESTASSLKVPLTRKKRTMTSPIATREGLPSSLPKEASRPKESLDAKQSLPGINAGLPITKKEVKAQPKLDSQLKKSLSQDVSKSPNAEGVAPTDTTPGSSPTPGSLPKSGTSTPRSLSTAKKHKPNFSGLAIPNTLIDESDDGRPTLMFEKKKRTGRLSSVGLGSGSSTNIAGMRPAGPSRTRSSMSAKAVDLSTSDERTPLIQKASSEASLKGFLSTDDTIRSKQKKNSSNTVSWSVEEEPEQNKNTAKSVRIDVGDEEDEDEEDDTDDSEDQGAYLSFNDLPAKAQHVILNDMMWQTSKDSVVIFSTLPAPTIGTHKSEEESWQYVDSLDVWCDNLPPIILLHSQTMTVTTAL